MDEIQKKLKRLERIEKAIKEFKIGYGCADKEIIKTEVEQFSEHLLDIYAEVEQFFEHLLDIYLEG